jgi:hypothetical protein
MRLPEEILADVKALALEYYVVTGKPLGIVGELAEYEAASILNLQLMGARSEGYDAIAPDGRRVQIKGRRINGTDLYRGRVPGINLEKDFDSVVLVLFDQQFNLAEIWEANRVAVEERLIAPGSKARNERGSLAIRQFKSIAKQVWSHQG